MTTQEKELIFTRINQIQEELDSLQQIKSHINILLYEAYTKGYSSGYRDRAKAVKRRGRV